MLLRRAPLGARGRGAADPDRARHRLVGRRPVPARPAARPARGRPQPDVGDARRARDRDLDRVQRAALGALPPGARGRRRARRARSSSTYASTGAAVLASGATAIAGFAALIASDIRMLRDFGIVTVVDLTVSLLGVMIVLPAALIWAEQHGPFALRDLDLRPLRGRAPRTPRGRAVSDDRFEDLGRPSGAGAEHRRAARRARPHASRAGRAGPSVPRPGNKYAWAVGILMLMVLSVLLFFQTLPNRARASRARSRGSRSRRSPRRPRSATWRATPTSASSEPTAPTGRARARPASVRSRRGREHLRAAPQAARAHLHLRPRRRLLPAGRPHRAGAGRACPGVNFATVFFTPQGARRGARGSCEARGWRQPVAVDRDGAVANLYGVGGCPTTVFARAGGQGGRRPSSATSPRTSCAGQASAARRTDGARARARAGSRPSWPRSSPSCGLVHAPLEARPRPRPRARSRSACARWPTATRAAR